MVRCVCLSLKIKKKHFMSCTCNIDLLPLGSPRCSFDFSIIRGAIFFDASVVDDNTNFTDGILEIEDLIDAGLAVASPKFFDVTTDKEASVTQTFADGTAFYIRDGIRTFTGIVAKATPSQVGAFTNLRCKKTAVYLVDNNGNILGYIKDDVVDVGTKLYPIPIEAGTVDAILAFANDAAIRQSTVTFQFSQSVADKQLRGAAVSPEGFVIDLIENPAVGVYVNGISSSINQTSSVAVFQLYVDNGSLTLQTLTAEDWQATGSITGYNVTQALDFTITYSSVTNTVNAVEIGGYSASNVDPGDDLIVKKITLKSPFRSLLAKEIEIMAV
jgi:hypothetical protein